MRDLHRAGGVAAEVGHQLLQRAGVQEACEHVASVAEDHLHVDVGSGSLDLLQVAIPAQVHPDLWQAAACAVAVLPL